MAIGFHWDYTVAQYGTDDNYEGLSVVKSIGLEYMIPNEDLDVFLNMMYYIPKNKRYATSFIVGINSGWFRLGGGFCYAEYYEPKSYSVEIPSVKSAFSLGCLLGFNHCFDNNCLVTMDWGMFLLGSHMMFDLRLGIGLKWDRK